MTVKGSGNGSVGGVEGGESAAGPDALIHNPRSLVSNVATGRSPALRDAGVRDWRFEGVVPEP